MNSVYIFFKSSFYKALGNLTQKFLRRFIFLTFFIGSQILVSCNHKNSTEPKMEHNRWFPINSGFSDLHIQALVVDYETTNVLYASSFNGIFKSIDAGKTWRLANRGISSNDIKTITLNPTSNNQLFVGTWNDGIFVTDDSANNWRPINCGIEDLRIRLIVIDPNNPNHIFAASESMLFESSNGGTKWQSTNIPSGNFRSLAHDCETELLFAGTDYSGIYRSDDNGNTWKEINKGIPQSDVGYFYTVAALHLISDPTTSVWAAIKNHGTYHSKDYGQSWELFSEDLIGTVINCLSLYTLNSDLLIVGTNKGVFLSTNGAKNFQQINNGLTNYDVRALAIDPKNTKIFYAGTMGGGVFKYIRE